MSVWRSSPLIVSLLAICVLVGLHLAERPAYSQPLLSYLQAGDSFARSGDLLPPVRNSFADDCEDKACGAGGACSADLKGRECVIKGSRCNTNRCGGAVPW